MVRCRYSSFRPGPLRTEPEWGKTRCVINLLIMEVLSDKLHNSYFKARGKNLALFSVLFQEKREEVWLSTTTKAPTPAEMSKGQGDNTNNTTKKFDYTAVADRLRTVRWSNYGHPTGVVDRFTFPLPATAVYSNGHTFKTLLINLLI